MNASPFTVRFVPDRTHRSVVPLTAAEAAAQCELWIEHPCGGRGNCSQCRVRFHVGAPAVSAADRVRLTDAERAAGWRLSCQALVAADAVIELLPQAGSVTPKSFGPDLLPAHAGRCGEGAGLGLAIDAGTTTLAAALVDRNTTRVLAAGSAHNPQARCGHDVIARIQYANESAGGGAELTTGVRDGLVELCGSVLAAAGIAAERVAAAVVCGNAFMTHSLLGVPVEPLGRAPYLGSFVASRTIPAAELGLPAAAGAAAWVFPQVRSHVGGDAVAALLAAELDRTARTELLIDLGTNTEIAVSHGGRILVASAAAGPAFEGGRISCGMRAEDGAIDRVSLGSQGDLQVHVRGGGAARGLCGTGLIDAAAALLEAGRLDRSGRLVAAAAGAVELTDGGAGQVVAVRAADLRELQLAKGAIAAGVQILLERIGATVAELDAVHLAGTFGSLLRKESALRIGLLPDLDPQRIRALGDAAGLGARIALCDSTARERALRLAARAEHVELAHHAAYADRFADAMAFPALREGT